MKKKMYVLGVAALMAALLSMAGVAQSAMWVGAQIGGNFNNTSVGVTASGGVSARSMSPQINPSVIGGATIGYDFVNAGFGAYAWPDWMKYFSFAMDLTYNRMVIQNSATVFSPSSRFNGWETAWTFLFMAHYGFMPDSEVPGGRINPYIGIGPALVWTGVQYSIPTAVNTRYHGNMGGDSMNVALVVEPGIRWMCFKNVSVDTAFRYRYAAPSWSNGPVTINTTLNQFAFLLRANLHF